MMYTTKCKDIISIGDFSKDEILHILDLSKHLKENPQPNLLKGLILGSCFFEPSTRTRLSFESAMIRMGGSVIGFDHHTPLSTKKGESLADSMKMMEQYADVVVLRHPLDGGAELAADSIDIPVINAGDGTNQHPTQTILDLFTILESQTTLENLNIALVGDLKYGRTVHSLAQALSHFSPRLFFVSPESLQMPKEISDELRAKQVKFSFHCTLEEILHKLDILYMTRIQQERFIYQSEYDELKNSFVLRREYLKNVKPNLKILHPLPRVGEIDQLVDQTTYACYFKQAKNGLYTRQALLGMVLGRLPEKGGRLS